MPTMKDVAKRAGVAVMTVSRVINNSGYVSTETRARVERAIRELDYVPNSVARSLRSSQTNTIALLIGDINNPFWTDVIDGAQQAAHHAGFRLILCNTLQSLVDQRDYLELVVERQVDGILLHALPNSTELIKWVQVRNIPLVTLDLAVANAIVDYVYSDTEAGAYQMTRLLVELGHRRIAAFSGPLEFSTMRDRVSGYRRALADFGLQDEEIIYTGSWGGASGYQMARRALQSDPRPTALFAFQNFMAYGVLSYVRDQGLRIPEDMTVVGFDEFHSEMDFDPFLTLVAQSPFEMGLHAGELLVGRIKGEIDGPVQEIVLPTEIRMRQSSGPPISQSRSA